MNQAIRAMSTNSSTPPFWEIRANDTGFTSRYIRSIGSLHERGMFRLMLLGRPLKSDDPLDLGAAMRKVLHGYANDRDGNLILIGTMET